MPVEWVEAPGVPEPDECIPLVTTEGREVGYVTTAGVPGGRLAVTFTLTASASQPVWRGLETYGILPARKFPVEGGSS